MKQTFVLFFILGVVSLAQAKSWNLIEEEKSSFYSLSQKVNMYSWFYQLEENWLEPKDIKKNLSEITLQLRTKNEASAELDLDIFLFPSNELYEPLLAKADLTLPEPFQSSYVDVFNNFIDDDLHTVYEGLDKSNKHDCASIYIIDNNSLQLAVFSTCAP